MTGMKMEQTIPLTMTFRQYRRTLMLVLASVILSACATPAFKNVSSAVAVVPSDVQQSPDRDIGAEVVWGGRILAIENREQSTEVEVIAYPLDRDQQPLPEASTVGRFILILPGFAEPLDYPVGRHLSVHGIVSGTRQGQVDQHDYLFPLLRAREVTVWPWGFMLDKKPRVHIGVGVQIR